jgi:O-antigen/teichoic acid export membrane protein
VKRTGLGLAGGLADQAIVSFGNFALNVTLARSLPAADYGAYSVVLSFILVLNTLHQALVTYPLSVQTAPSGRPLAIALLLTPLCALAFLPLLGVATASVGHLGLLPAAGAALVCWQMQEVVRRGLLADSRHVPLIALDALRYLGPLAAVWGLRAHLAIGGVFLVVAAASALAAIPVALRLGRDWRSAAQGLRAEIPGHWRLGAPVLGANLLAALSTQWFLWLLAWHDDAPGAAALVALANVVAVASPVIFGMENVLVPEVARARDTLSFPGLLRLVGRRGLVAAGLVGPLFLVILAAPDWAARLFYGRDSAYAGHPGELRLLALAYACYLAATLFSAALRGYRASGAVFRMQLYPALFGLTLGSWLTWRFGLSGACVASVAAGALRAAVGLVYLLRLRPLTVARPALAAS